MPQSWTRNCHNHRPGNATIIDQEMPKSQTRKCTITDQVMPQSQTSKCHYRRPHTNSGRDSVLSSRCRELVCGIRLSHRTQMLTRQQVLINIKRIKIKQPRSLFLSKIIAKQERTLRITSQNKDQTPISPADTTIATTNNESTIPK